ncbi:MAG: type II toxin-antitoxin system RatA family toxin [Burkholderiaceae bacterium]
MSTNTIEKSVLLPYPADAMFALIDRIEDYPGFLPWCGGTEVMRPEEGPLTATVRIAFKGLKQEFTTRNRHRPPASDEPGSVTMELIDGPFRHLDGDWRIESLSDSACKVSFRLDYEMRSGLLGRALSPVFGQIATTFIDSFVREAERRHG